MEEVDEGDVRGADEEGEEPDDENDQECVPCGQTGGQRVDDAHVPTTVGSHTSTYAIGRDQSGHWPLLLSPLKSVCRFKLY